jgi:hypothetical protein
VRFYNWLPVLAIVFLWSSFTKKPSIPATRSVFTDELFESNEVLNIKLSGGLRDLFNDRSDNAKYHDITVSYPNKDGKTISIPVRAKTRGNFRRKLGNCTYPPIWLDFSENKNQPASLFSGQAKLKLVMPCRGDDLVVREYLLYKIYNLVTEKSFRARLVKVETEDTKRKKNGDPFFGMLLEEDKQMAKRNHSILVKRPMLRMQSTEKDAFLKMAVFEYLIGNTDWSVEYQQNIRLLAKDSLSIPTPVPYDFDHAGLVEAPYAQPAEELQMRSVRERRYRGYCINDMKEFAPVIAFYNDLKKDIYALYTNCNLIDSKYLKATIKYLDEFYNTINDAKQLQEAFGYPCRPDGTGNVIIKGLDKD